jgi:dihydrofolate reductase
MSLDGCIAGPNGEFDWIVVDPEIDFGALFKDFDAVLMGRKSYEVARGGEMPGIQAYVFSTTLRQADCPDVTVSDNPGETVRKLKAASGKDIWLFGGGVLFRSLLELGLVDRVQVAVIPVLLGDGLPMLQHPAKQANLRLTGHALYKKTGTILLDYETVFGAESEVVE